MSDEVRKPDRFGCWTQDRIDRIPEYKNEIVRGIRNGLWISEISEQIRVSTLTIAAWRQQDTEFGELYREAESAFVDTLEREAIRRAMHGVADVVIQGGKVVMDPRTLGDEDGPKPLLKRTYSDGLMMFVLKGRRREVYGDKLETDNTHKINVDGAREALAAKLRAAATAQPVRRALPGETVAVSPPAEDGSE